MSIQNKAAWFEDPAKPLRFGDAPYTRPGPGEVVIKNHAWGINHIDWLFQGPLASHLHAIPNVIGEDIAGVIHEVGDGVTAFKPGDRVLGHPIQIFQQEPKFGGFQFYTVIPEFAVAKIPDTISFEQAAVIPLGFDTAAVGLFNNSHLGLELPKIGSLNETNAAKVVLVSGGASVVGASAVQLASRAGYTVVATASSANLGAVEKLGAKAVIDYKVPEAVNQIVEKIKSFGTLTAVYDAACNDTSGALLAPVIDRTNSKVVIAIVSNPPKELYGKNLKPLTSLQIYYNNPANHWGFLPEVTEDGRVGKYLMGSWLTEALSRKDFVTFPPARIVGNLEDAQKGIDLLKGGVSAQKLILTL